MIPATTMSSLLRHASIDESSIGVQILQPAGIFIERMPGNIKAERRIFGSQKFVLRPFFHFGQNLRAAEARPLRRAAANKPCWPLSLARCNFWRALDGAVDHRNHLRAMRAQAVQSPRANQAFEHALIQQPRIDRFAEFEESS